jgi:hypothetical protein
MERLIDDTNKTVEEYNRLVEEESKLIKGETAKQLLTMETNKASMIMNAISKKLA